MSLFHFGTLNTDKNGMNKIYFFFDIAGKFIVAGKDLSNAKRLACETACRDWADTELYSFNLVNGEEISDAELEKISEDFNDSRIDHVGCTDLAFFKNHDGTHEHMVEDCLED